MHATGFHKSRAFLEAICVWILLSFFPGHVWAQDWSYVYIQGDKETPFYVKLEDQMLPRYSKDYCIVSQLAPGPVRLQILFQQNKFPPLYFNIQVPDHGARGFMLMRRDSAFALYDIQQKFFLAPGDAGEDHLPEIINVPPPRPEMPAAATIAPASATEQAATENSLKPGAPAFMPDVDLRREKNNRKEGNQPSALQTPTFSEVSLNNPRGFTSQLAADSTPTAPSPPTSSVETSDELTATAEDLQNEPMREPEVDFGLQQTAITNSDCPGPMADTDFDALYNHTISRKGDDKRILYLIRKVKGNCFSCRQAAILATRLETESMRYSFLKKVYPRISDQQYFAQLEQLFKTKEWKAYFRLIQQ